MNQKELIFIVDDEPMHAQMMEDHLKSKYPNFEIIKYKTGEECADNMNKNPGIVILDYHLDSVDKGARSGIQILKFIKKEYEHTEVIMISGQDKIEVAIDCMREGAYDYIIKNETSFMRAENAIDRLTKHRLVVHNLAQYRRLNNILIIGLTIIVAVSIILFATGVIN